MLKMGDLLKTMKEKGDLTKFIDTPVPDNATRVDLISIHTLPTGEEEVRLLQSPTGHYIQIVKDNKDNTLVQVCCSHECIVDAICATISGFEKDITDSSINPIEKVMLAGQVGEHLMAVVEEMVENVLGSISSQGEQETPEDLFKLSREKYQGTI